MRDLMLARIVELREKWASDLFGKPNRKGNLRPGVVWRDDFDFAAIKDDAELLRQFEKLVHMAYRQR